MAANPYGALGATFDGPQPVSAKFHPFFGSATARYPPTFCEPEPPSALLVWARRSLQTCAIVEGASVGPLLVKKPPTGSAQVGALCAGASVVPPLRHEKITRRPLAYWARVEPMPGHDVPLLLPPLAAE